MVIYYDSFCPMCTNSSILWKKLDLHHRLTFFSFRDLENYPQAMEEKLHVKHDGKWFAGYNALIQIVKQLPLLWIMLPAMYLLKWIGLGDFLYQKIAKNRKLIPVNQCRDESCPIPDRK
ncbi:DCC1-like thiol-disulfide oxidoreductase family protein [Lentibacillus sp. L22]|uniref:thiol-disulfide oxidoreductase DCC family protein n=1 Tax=Lentibacillus TaxID=175304 RepID=UPI0022B1021D|nr:DCC1-like thiol-disulfide oxidoreductase family protein [Lentibacillus daqui]